MLIPKKISLAGLTITVELDPKFFEVRKVLGEAQYPQQRIVVDGSDLLHHESREQTYIHEVVHWILYVMSEDELKNNEKFVETFAFLLHQVLKSSEHG